MAKRQLSVDFFNKKKPPTDTYLESCGGPGYSWTPQPKSCGGPDPHGIDAYAQSQTE